MMTGSRDLQQLIANLSPTLVPGEFVFITFRDGNYGDGGNLQPIASFQEQEGLTLIVRKETAESASKEFDAVFRMITLRAHSSLEAVGLTAAVANALSRQGISANVVAAYYHDHVFVTAASAQDAMEALLKLADEGIRAD